MFITVNEHDFIEAFRRMGRMYTPDNPEGNFSGNALRALFEYLEDMEAGSDEPIELDVIGLCCEFAEYPSAWEAFQDYADPSDIADGEENDEDEREEGALEFFRDNTTLIGFVGGIIIGEF